MCFLKPKKWQVLSYTLFLWYTLQVCTQIFHLKDIKTMIEYMLITTLIISRKVIIVERVHEVLLMNKDVSVLKTFVSL